ncbi:mannosyl-oligosaccharide 1,2-alpha-mannosidase MNS3 [Cynara cardunculus var. scolymus]|uniref:alpha-1,2-Mannosidase n=1 Tax=Cynara cardunculus var. scolymus TaxID=59895 RepID=A0A118JT48_CYNCS|nr:mannosyl-oligosaccharide 1,2-alpha-mannosidase MNS3 [Cynara cardunculus var. scolymus]KVH89422.1 Glycoside hydrolase, family 47 [Cynara cardunculus var. scolymus]
MSSKTLPYSIKDIQYDNAKFRRRSLLQVISHTFLTKRMKRECMACSTGKFLALLMICGLTYLVLTHASPIDSITNGVSGAFGSKEGDNSIMDGGIGVKRFWRKPPRLPPRLSPDEVNSHNRSMHGIAKPNQQSEWIARQESVQKAFIHAWSGYKKYAMGYDELMPLSQRGVDGLGGLGATVVDALDTAMIMRLDDVVFEAGSWIEKHLPERISQRGQVNLFETTIRVVGGLLSAYHLSVVQQEGNPTNKGPKPSVYLENAKNLADILLTAFTSSPTAIPFSDVVLQDRTAHAAPDGLSSTSEASTLQLEFNYLSFLTGDPKYSFESMKVLEHMKTLPKVEGLVPIYISPTSGEFSGSNIRLGSRGDSYYEYLIKVWLQQRQSNRTYLHDMYEEAMKGVKHLLVRKSKPNGLVFVGELPAGVDGGFSPKMDHLVCFLPGTLALGATKGITKAKAMEENLLTFEDLENLKLAEDLAKTCYEMYSVTSTGLAPEIAYFNSEGYSEDGLDGGNKTSEYIHDIVIKHADRHNLLRPETVESLFILYRITEDSKYREWGWSIFKAFEKYTKVDSGGYSSLDDVTVLPPRRRDKMETFFLGETLKYLFLLFGDGNVIPLTEFVFNTEAHPIPIMTTRKNE